jgi:5-methylcytosine-specific restriction endonuclease McrA
MARRQHLPWIVILFVVILAFAIISDWWAENPLWWGLGTGLVVGGVIFAIFKYPAFRQKVWSGLKIAGKDFDVSFAEEEEKKTGKKPFRKEYVPKERRARIVERADGICENPRCRFPRQLEFHHINGNHNDHRYSNLVYLCRRCHTDAHGSIAGFRKEQIELWIRDNEKRLQNKYRT